MFSPPRCERWHTRNTCFTLTLSGIWNDVNLPLQPLVWLMFSLWTLWNQLTVCRVLSLSLTLTGPFPFLTFELCSHFIWLFTSLSHARWGNVLFVALQRGGNLIVHMHIPEHRNMLNLHFKCGSLFKNSHVYLNDVAGNKTKTSLSKRLSLPATVLQSFSELV